MAAVAVTTEPPRDRPDRTPPGHPHAHAGERASTGTFGRHRWVLPAGLGLLAAAGVAYTAWQDPNADGVFPQCPTRTLFGVDCPGCGGLRAVHAAAHGDVVAAADHNVVLAVGLPLVALLWLGWLLHTLGVRVPRLPRVPRTVWVGLAVLVVAFSVVRNVEGVGLFEYLSSTA